MKDLEIMKPMKLMEETPNEGEGIPPELLVAGLDILKESIRCFTEYQIAKEHEKTERQRIKAYMNVLLAKIASDKDRFIEIFKFRYNERRELYALAQKELNKATENNDHEMVRLAYSFILTVYSSGDTLTVNMMSLDSKQPNLL